MLNLITPAMIIYDPMRFTCCKGASEYQIGGESSVQTFDAKASSDYTHIVVNGHDALGCKPGGQA